MTKQIISIPDTNSNSNIDNITIQNKQISELIDLFRYINPSYKRFFSIPAQRNALKNLLESFSFTQLQKAISILPETNCKEYAPVITSPFELELKITKLISFVQREKSKAQKPNSKYRPIMNANKK